MGITEIVVLVIVALVVVRPADVPRLARKIGQIFGTLRKYRATLDAEMRRLGSLDALDNDDRKTLLGTNTRQTNHHSQDVSSENKEEKAI